MRVLEKYKGKDINVVMTGAGGATSGKLVEIYDQYFIMETSWSSKQHFSLAQLQSFWCDKDKPKD